jgi:hypothetical protein
MKEWPLKNKIKITKQKCEECVKLSVALSKNIESMQNNQRWASLIFWGVR